MVCVLLFYFFVIYYFTGGLVVINVLLLFSVCHQREPVVVVDMRRLLDLAARVVAKHMSCEDLELVVPALDDALLKKVSPHF